MVIFGLMENEGTKLVRELLAMDCSVWEIAKRCGVSYQTGKAWKRGWWNPDATNTHKLFIMKIEKDRERKGA